MAQLSGVLFVLLDEMAKNEYNDYSILCPHS